MEGRGASCTGGTNALRLMTETSVEFEVTLRVRGQGGTVSEVSLARIRRTGDEEVAMSGLGLA